MHAVDDGVYHVQLRGTIPSCTFIIQRNVSLDQTSSGNTGSVRVIDGELFIFTAPFLFMQHLHILSSKHNVLLYFYTYTLCGVCMNISTVYAFASKAFTSRTSRPVGFIFSCNFLQFPGVWYLDAL